MNVLHIKSSRIPVIEKNVNTTYQLMGRQEKEQMNIHQEEHIQV